MAINSKMKKINLKNILKKTFNKKSKKTVGKKLKGKKNTKKNTKTVKKIKNNLKIVKNLKTKKKDNITSETKPQNLKITTPNDLDIANYILNSMNLPSDPKEILNS